MTLSIQLGGSISSAAVVVLLDRRQRAHSDVLAGHTAQASASALHPLAGDLGRLFSIVQSEATVLAYADVAFAISAIAFALIPIVAVVRRPPKGKPLEAVAG